MGAVDNADDVDQYRTAANGVCFLKFVLKNLLETLSGPEFVDFIDGYNTSENGFYFQRPGSQILSLDVLCFVDLEGNLGRWMRCLLNVALKGNVSETAYLLTLECIQCLVVGSSTQLFLQYVTWSPGVHPVLEFLMEQSHTAGTLIQNLCRWYIERPKLPSSVTIYRKKTENSSGVFKYVRKAAGLSF